MTADTLEDKAMQVALQLVVHKNNFDFAVAVQDVMLAFADKAVAAERARCAALCDSEVIRIKENAAALLEFAADDEARARVLGAHYVSEIAATIRAKPIQAHSKTEYARMTAQGALRPITDRTNAALHHLQADDTIDHAGLAKLLQDHLTCAAEVTAAENEACAFLCENASELVQDSTFSGVAKAIRQRLSAPTESK